MRKELEEARNLINQLKQENLKLRKGEKISITSLESEKAEAIVLSDKKQCLNW